MNIVIPCHAPLACHGLDLVGPNNFLPTAARPMSETHGLSERVHHMNCEDSFVHVVNVWTLPARRNLIVVLTQSMTGLLKAEH